MLRSRLGGKRKLASPVTIVPKKKKPPF